MSGQKVQTLRSSSLEILQIWARDGNSSLEDWNLLLSRTPQNVDNVADFQDSAVRLSFGNDKVAKDNFVKLKQFGEQIVEINAHHSSPNAKHVSAEDMDGLEPIVYFSKLEKDKQISVTAFAKVLSQFLDEDILQYKDKEEELTEKQCCC